jgi:hypothetical protein
MVSAEAFSRSFRSMNYKTAAECYWEICGRDRYWGGAIEVLLEEIAESIEIGEDKKQEMRKALREIAQDIDRSQGLDVLWVHLFEDEEFQKEWGLILLERLVGKRPRNPGIEEP